MFLEICVDSLESALAAQRGGADRLELCSYLPAGGLTPSHGLMQLVKEKINIPVHVMIRHREGDFVYCDDEFEIMKADIQHARKMGFEGVVFGLLTPDGMPDISRIKDLINLARPMKVCFHRAFDVCADPFEAMEQLIACGIDTILTSGQKIKAEAGAALIASLKRQAGVRIEILPGSGITDQNIQRLASETGLQQFHLSATKHIAPGPYSNMHYIPMGREDNPGADRHIADEEMIKRIKA